MAVLGTKERKRYAEFDKKAMEKVHYQALLDEGKPNLKEHMTKMKEEMVEKE